MDALEAILTRRSVARVSDRCPTKEAVKGLLEAAVRAPNHYLTEPWRFVVLTGQALDDLGGVMAARVGEELTGTSEIEARMALERRRPRRAPVIVTVVYVPSTHPRAREIEDRYSVGAALQNLLLAAHASGMAAHIRTGPAAADGGVHRLLGLHEGEEIAGFVYLGYPVGGNHPVTRRTPAADLTTWLGWD